MDNPTTQRRTDRRDESASFHVVRVPAPHAGIGRALRNSFGSPAPLPDDWSRFLDRLR